MSTMIAHPFRAFLLCLSALTLIACGGGNIGPDERLLYGTWAQDGVTQADPTVLVENAVITYEPDGTSDFSAVMTVTQNNGIPERFTIAADVNWSLEETVLTRTLQDVTITPDISTADADAMARILADAYRNSPPGRLIVEQVDGVTMALLDVETGSIMTYTKQPDT